MANVTRRIGLSLGADLCWPLCYEQILRKLDLELKLGPDNVRFEVERLTIEPYDLRAAPRYDVVLDRLTHWYHTSREWIKKAILLDGTYVLNNPWSLQSMEKQTTYCAMMRLGLPVPDTWMVPPKEYEPSEDLQPTLERYARMFDLGDIGKQLGYPMFMKPYDGGAWRGVNRIDDEERLRKAYDESGRLVMHLQKAVDPFDMFVRCIGVGPQLNPVLYDPAAPLHERYGLERDFLSAEDRELIENMTLTINTFFGWDFNSCEALRQVGEDGHSWHPIDFANACPDSQVTSLHYHFPWLVLSKLRWSIFCAATRRPMRTALDWGPFFAIADENPDMPLREKLAAYGAIARERLDVERFEAFCEEHLGQLDEVADEYFRGDDARDAVRQKVVALFPEHEHDQFTEHFWNQIQLWRTHEAERRAATPAKPAAGGKTAGGKTAGSKQAAGKSKAGAKGKAGARGKGRKASGGPSKKPDGPKKNVETQP